MKTIVNLSGQKFPNWYKKCSDSFSTFVHFVYKVFFSFSLPFSFALVFFFFFVYMNNPQEQMEVTTFPHVFRLVIIMKQPIRLQADQGYLRREEPAAYSGHRK